ncbi:MAG: alpha/beta fold hydrolase [Chloroflexota bacterium]|nr:alpha/beta hydrolase [Chloroflexota bacterium]MBI5703382.1 alpha/beta hydrolase [Chloroflexota bacterium]
MSKLNQQFRLPDGRRFGYDEHGPSDGKPLFYFHGSPGSRREVTLYVREEILYSLNIRLIAMDRPGMGLSDFQPARRLLDFPGDVLALADHLSVERFSLLAYSLGGPYGFACAFAIPQRLHRVGIISGAALFTESELMETVNEGTRKFLTLPREKPFLSHLFIGLMLGVMPRLAPQWFVAQANSLLPKPDRVLLITNPMLQHGFVNTVREATRQGTRGAHHESLLAVTEYGFRLQDIQTPVIIWHGEKDKNIPVEMARFAASAIPNCEAKFYPNEGHLSLFKKHAEEIVRALVA